MDVKNVEAIIGIDEEEEESMPDMSIPGIEEDVAALMAVEVEVIEAMVELMSMSDIEDIWLAVRVSEDVKGSSDYDSELSRRPLL
jgi:hypothetical protein